MSKPEGHRMLIAEAAIETGFSKDTIRYYEKIGLIEPERDNQRHAGYRRFGSAEIERLRKIRGLKEFGFTLGEIKALFELKLTSKYECESVNRFVAKKISDIDRKIIELREARSRLESARKRCVGECADTVETNSHRQSQA
ncbi:MAG: MerR family transcriptional regulator [Pyrinomonadaceae bacterium]|nr:MerR family transcriptional regulator [Pyrinomonadaceae bacterium]